MGPQTPLNWPKWASEPPELTLKVLQTPWNGPKCAKIGQNGPLNPQNCPENTWSDDARNGRTDGRTDGLTFSTLTQVEPENLCPFSWCPNCINLKILIYYWNLWYICCYLCLIISVLLLNLVISIFSVHFLTEFSGCWSWFSCEFWLPTCAYNHCFPSVYTSVSIIQTSIGQFIRNKTRNTCLVQIFP